MRVVDVRPTLKEVTIPVLAVFAIYPNMDPISRKEQGPVLLNGLTDLEITWVEGASHWIHEDYLDTFEAAVIPFLEQGNPPD